MKTNLQNDFSGSPASFSLPRYAQIPDVGLYLEQVVRYINSCLSPLGEPELTASMVSNYVKKKLLPVPKKKLYTADHLARLLFIAVVKPVASLDQLQLMFRIQSDNASLPAVYDYFCDAFEQALSDSPDAETTRPMEIRSDARDLLHNTILAIVSKIRLDCYLQAYQRQHVDSPANTGD